MGLWQHLERHMKLLLDTHIVLWWMDDDPQLKRQTRSLIADGSNEVLVSTASLWEIAIKHQIGKLRASAPAVDKVVREEGFQIVSFSVEHLAAIQMLTRHHADPFDHMLIVQAQLAGAALISQDRQMTLYDVTVIPNR